ncbi:MAG: winged helix-turn-helix transcriptional regulator [Candidatus Marinimicrobia bacterium]|nr:winged helix-turn-helix transcriptional regulator [Candidatus Neomarinimicrobiota bacterium]
MNKQKKSAGSISCATSCCTLEISGTKQKKLMGLLKAISNPTRFEILKYLVKHPGCITLNFVDHLPIAQATVSQHMKVLREAGWIESTLTGTATCYSLNESNILWFKTKIGEIF